MKHVRETVVAMTAAALVTGAAQAQQPPGRQEEHIRLCPMPVKRPHRPAVTMPVSEPPATAQRPMPLLPARCRNPLDIDAPSASARNMGGLNPQDYVELDAGVAQLRRDWLRMKDSTIASRRRLPRH